MIFKSEKKDWNDLIGETESKGEIDLEERFIIQRIVSWLVVVSRIRPAYDDWNGSKVKPLDLDIEINDRIDRYIPQNSNTDKKKIIEICKVIFEAWSQVGEVLEGE